MLNLESSLKLASFYSSDINLSSDIFLPIGEKFFFSRVFYQKFLLILIFTVLFIELFCQQFPEIKLLQLVPGLYVLFFLVLALFLFGFLTISFLLPLLLDGKKRLGTKANQKFQALIFYKTNIQSFWFSVFVVQTSLFPLSLDSFLSYGEEKIENVWALDEVLSFEFFFFLFFILLSQIPSFFLFCFSTKENFQRIPFIWRILIFSFFIIAGFLTPTLDAYTQVEFALIGLSFTFFLLQKSQNRLLLKYAGINSLTA